jgi:hypothetical protein
MEGPKQLFRIVIGAYVAPDLAASASRDLRKGGLAEEQLCIIAKTPIASPHAQTREIAGEVVAVSEPGLFDQVWSPSPQPEQPLTPWMTKAQSKAILDSLRNGALVLLVSAATATEQVRASQIQLNHHPSMVQAYSFSA